jgi:primosomal protein N' (replication factor Y)
MSNLDFNAIQNTDLIYAEVLIPGGLPEALWYKIPPELMHLKKGAIIQVPLQRRAAVDALLWKKHSEKPPYKLRNIKEHPYSYTFDKDYLLRIEWLSQYYLCTPNQALAVFWPADLKKYLKYRFEKKELKEWPTPQEIPEAPPLREEQEAAFSALVPHLSSAKFHGALLQGVTGSGKTRVYVEWIKEARKLKQQVLLLVPEIGLTPQLHSELQKYLSEELLLLHSALPAAKKRRTWMRAMDNEAPLILGTRSSLLLPNLQPGLIIIDEEHDPSYKQHDPAPRYHSRELAFYLANRHQGTVVLGSATPSLETRLNAAKGNLQHLHLRTRISQSPLPQVKLIPMREQRYMQGELLLSAPLREAVQRTVDEGKQVILLHNRRGYSNARICEDCGHTLECQDCCIPLIYHRKDKQLHCHYCDRLYPLHTPCRECGSKNYVFQGQAIEQSEEEVSQWIKGAKVLRLDRDSTARKGSMEKLLKDFRKEEYNILVGTQMVAKGHDFPKVQLVGIINADIGTALPDFRTNERSFQLLTQVSGRAGRKEGGGQVFLQSWNPENPVFGFAAKHDYEAFYQWEMKLRQDSFYPPFSQVVHLEISGRNEAKVQEAARLLAEHLRQALNGQGQCLGPAEAFVARVRKQHRLQILLKHNSLQELRKACSYAIRQVNQLKLPVLIHADLQPMQI